LDADRRLERSLANLGLERRKQYMAVGLDTAGKRNIEGLVPETVRGAVYSAHANLVQEATQGTKEEQESARNKLKKLILEEFKRKATPGGEYFGGFYPLVKLINAALG
jgi:hypothetical protein